MYDGQGTDDEFEAVPSPQKLSVRLADCYLHDWCRLGPHGCYCQKLSWNGLQKKIGPSSKLVTFCSRILVAIMELIEISKKDNIWYDTPVQMLHSNSPDILNIQNKRATSSIAVKVTYLVSVFKNLPFVCLHIKSSLSYNITWFRLECHDILEAPKKFTDYRT